jgi:hypothetical protein
MLTQPPTGSVACHSHQVYQYRHCHCQVLSRAVSLTRWRCDAWYYVMFRGTWALREHSCVLQMRTARLCRSAAWHPARLRSTLTHDKTTCKGCLVLLSGRMQCKCAVVGRILLFKHEMQQYNRLHTKRISSSGSAWPKHKPSETQAEYIPVVPSCMTQVSCCACFVRHQLASLYQCCI